MVKDIKISYAITVCNEHMELERLLNQLNEWVDNHDQIIIQKDHDNVTDDVIEVINKFNEICKCEFDVISFPLRNDFAAFKNHLKAYCRKDYIFQIDADEIPHKNLINNLQHLLEHNPEIDMFLVPRINTVEGITEKHIKQWGWKIDDKLWINYPDFQSRIYKNIPEIKWEGKVHERIQGARMYSTLPEDEIWSLYHPKTIERQEKQNNFYESL